MGVQISLVDLKTGQTATVVEIHGGWGMQRRLQGLGIRPGVKIRKVSAAFRPGAVVVATIGGQAALGFGVARKLIVEGTV